MRQRFFEFLNALMEANPEIVEEMMTDDVREFIETLKDTKSDKPEISEKGIPLLKYMRECTDRTTFKARDIAEGLFLQPRSVSGTMRSLVNNGFVECLGKSPCVYALTEKGKNYEFIEE